MPAGHPKIAVDGEFEVVGPSLSPDTHPVVIPSDVVVEKHVGAVHPVTAEQTHASAGIQGVAAVMTTSTGLHKEHVMAAVVKRDKQVKSAVVQSQIRVKPQLDAGCSDQVEPLTHRCLATGQGS